jgi:CheY-like chemotaxis protein
MQKVLILSPDPNAVSGIEELLAGQQVRIKLVHDNDLVLQLARGRDYDIFILTNEIPEALMQEIGAALWSRNPSTLAITTRTKGTFTNSPAYYKLHGFVPVEYADLKNAILSLVNDPTVSSKDSFHILVVEDLDSPRDIICIFLESLGYSQVTGCSSANECLSLLEADPTRYSCIVTDIRMPKISGKEMIEIIRSHPKMQHLPIVVLTAYGTLDMLVDCLRVGASGFLVKPPKKDDMQRELARALRIYQKKENPRLASLQEAEYIRDMVESRKVT